MSKRPSYEIKLLILKAVKEKQSTYAQLERKINTNFDSIKANCQELQRFGQIKIEQIQKHPKNGRLSYIVSITEFGLKTLNESKN